MTLTGGVITIDKNDSLFERMHNMLLWLHHSHPHEFRLVELLEDLEKQEQQGESEK